MAWGAAEFEFKDALRRLRFYDENGLIDELSKYLKSPPSATTVANYLNGKGARVGSKKYKDFIKMMADVPSPDEREKILLYAAILKSMDMQPSSQAGLRPYDGKYKIILPEQLEQYEEFFRLFIHKTVVNHQISTFIMSYRQSKKHDRHICDGMCFLRGKRIFYIGTFKDTTFLAHVDTVDYPGRRPLLGSMKFECIPDEIFIETPFALISTEDRALISPEILQETKKRLADS